MITCDCIEFVRRGRHVEVEYVFCGWPVLFRFTVRSSRWDDCWMGISIGGEVPWPLVSQCGNRRRSEVFLRWLQTVLHLRLGCGSDNQLAVLLPSLSPLFIIHARNHPNAVSRNYSSYSYKIKDQRFRSFGKFTADITKTVVQITPESAGYAQSTHSFISVPNPPIYSNQPCVLKVPLSFTASLRPEDLPH